MSDRTVSVPAETVEKLRAALAESFAEMDPGTLRRMYGEVGVAALAVVDAATPAASVPAVDTPGVSHTNANVEGCVTCRNIQELGCMCGPNGCECPAPAAPVGEPRTWEASMAGWRCSLCGGILHGPIDAISDAAHVKVCYPSNAPVPVNDEAEAAWQAYKAHPVPDDYRANRKSFLAGFRAARGEDA